MSSRNWYVYSNNSRVGIQGVFAFIIGSTAMPTLAFWHENALVSATRCQYNQ